MRYVSVVSGTLLLCGLIMSFFTHNDLSDIYSYKEMPELRAAWVQARSITTPEKVDQILDQAEAGQFNAVVVNVFVFGYAYYESNLLEKQPNLAPDFDPLAYLIKQAHRRNIQVHTWLVAGPVGGLEGPILSRHPEWAMVSVDGTRANWLNYNRPDVRQFIADIALELVKHYRVDGIHFDYTRYPHPGAKWGFDTYSINAFARKYNFNLEALRYTELPAYGEFDGNPLAEATTAQVLATFDNGRPAILLNSYGAGEVVLFNWEAERRQVAASSEILRRSINYLRDGKGKVHILRSEINAERYGWYDFDRITTWLKGIGWPPGEVTEGDLVHLAEDAVLVMPSVYLIRPQVAADLADFVRRGGGVIFIDGPSPSIRDEHIQAITGMRTSGGHFQETGLLVAEGNHELIPNSNREVDLAAYQALDAEAKTLRKQAINQLLQDVYQQVKRAAPHVLITITVAGNQQNLAEQVFLDWDAWLQGGYIDLIIPRVYVDQGESLEPAIAEWQPVMAASGQIMLGVKAYAYRGSREAKSPEQMLAEIELARDSGSSGIILFDLEGISDDILKALTTGPFSSPSSMAN